MGPRDEPCQKYMTDDCNEALDALEKEAEEQQRTHVTMGEPANCKDSEQTCTLTVDAYSLTSEKCFPASCQEANILKGMKEDMATHMPPEASASVNVTCRPAEPEPE